MATDSPERWQTRPLTFEEYLEIEKTSQGKHELVAGYMFDYNGGEIRGLAGATRRHNRIAGNIFAHLWAAANGGPSQVYGSDMLLRVSETSTYYPDVQVVSDPTDTDRQYTARPCLVVEVLSPSTAAVDRREKLLEYQSLQSLQAYLMVWSDERRCMLHYRADNGQWLSACSSGPSGDLQLPCVDLRLSLDQIYAGVNFDS